MASWRGIVAFASYSCTSSRLVVFLLFPYLYFHLCFLGLLIVRTKRDRI